MTFTEKEQQMLNKLKETNYLMFGGNKEHAFAFIAAQLQTFPDYTNTVIRQQIMQPIWYAKLDGQELRDAVSNMDRQRKSAHDAAIAGITILNRFSKNLDLEPFADIDTTDRHAVQEFVGTYVNEVYNQGISSGGQFDSAVLNKTQNYDTKNIADRVRKINDKINSLETQGDENDIQYN